MAYSAESPSSHVAPAGAQPLPAATADRPTTVWRTWLLAPERGPRRTVRPLLTGLYGFPWPSRLVEAKCTRRDRAHGYLASGTFTLDRHHPVIPDPHCTCGIYAGRDELADPRPHPVRGVPFVTGFVSLEGRVLTTSDEYRAQQARVVGPLTVTAGRPPVSAIVAQRLGVGLVPNRIVTSPIGYRTQWRRRAYGDLAGWLTDTAEQLADRYQVPVLTSSQRTRGNPPEG